MITISSADLYGGTYFVESNHVRKIQKATRVVSMYIVNTIYVTTDYDYS